MKRTLLICLLLILAPMAWAQPLAFNSAFGDHMVLQRNASVKIYGTSKPGAEVTLSLQYPWGESNLKTRSTAEGTWCVEFHSPDASKQPTRITAQTKGETAALNDVLFGDVWLCSGQSNMEMQMKGYRSQPIEGSLGRVATAGKHRLLRLYTVPRLTSDTLQYSSKGQWLECTPETVNQFSAIGYMFGAGLSETLDIPVGVIVSAFGGSRIEAWMTAESLQSYDTTEYLPAYKTTERHKTVGLLYKGMINPLLQTPLRGVIWYQGESNSSYFHSYSALLKEMVALWRAKWEQPDLPFLICQIAPYGRYRDSIVGAQFMEAQLDAVETGTNMVMVGTSDLGTELGIHPPKKVEIAERALILALSNVYGYQSLPLGGPTFQGVEYADGKALVSFHHAEMGLYPERTQIDHFEIAGADGIFHPARAEVKDHNFVEVWSDGVPAPVHVRYAFSSWHTVNLYNTAGLPAYPFRTDKP